LHLTEHAVRFDLMKDATQQRHYFFIQPIAIQTSIVDCNTVYCVNVARHYFFIQPIDIQTSIVDCNTVHCVNAAQCACMKGKCCCAKMACASLYPLVQACRHGLGRNTDDVLLSCYMTRDPDTDTHKIIGQVLVVTRATLWVSYVRVQDTVGHSGGSCISMLSRYNIGRHLCTT
jgi:hypothetical protein